MLHHNPKRVNGSVITLWAFLIGLIVSCGIVMVLGNSNSITAALTQASSHQPEKYTSLYFEDPGHLPSYAATGIVHTIYFHIVDHEQQARTYTYQIAMVIAGSSSVQSAAIQVANGQNVRQLLRFTIPKPNSSATIMVTLVGSSEQLLFRSHS
jgi:hypothetical protein